VKVEKLAKNGEKGQNSQPLSPHMDAPSGCTYRYPFQSLHSRLGLCVGLCLENAPSSRLMCGQQDRFAQVRVSNVPY
jgi:hypothetical protein